MKILHTSDWHLGAWLGEKENSRLPEQEKFIEELTEICDNENIDILIAAGDIFDSYMPSAAAETLFFTAMERLSCNGKRAIIVIAGNHDDPDRLTAAKSVLAKHGVILLGTPLDEPAEFENKCFSIKKFCKCCFEVRLLSGERAVIAAMPYPSEKRINTRLTGNENFNEEELQKSYSEKVGQLFDEMAEYFCDDSVNIAVGHFYLVGGEQSTGSERDISLGGGFAVFDKDLPDKTDYIALGHLHRSQSAMDNKWVYAGSPIAYSASEINYTKCIYIADIVKNEKRDIRKVLLKCPKPLEIWRFNSAEEAVEACEGYNGADCFAYISINSNRPLMQNEIKAMRMAKQGIINIEVHIEGVSDAKNELSFFEEKTISEEFADFYTETKGIAPAEEILSLFQEILLASQEQEREREENE